MNSFFISILDFIFPPKPIALELQALLPVDIFNKLPKAISSVHDFITPIFAYKNPLTTELIWSIKYKKDLHALECGGYALYKKLRELEVEKAILIPIPISKKRRNERGYNQCELLIEEIIKLDTEKRFDKRFDILVRTKHTERQTLKNREERLESTESIFNVNNYLDLNSQIIIIDDVVTTGSTIKEARDALLGAGFKDVSAITLAH